MMFGFLIKLDMTRRKISSEKAHGVEIVSNMGRTVYVFEAAVWRWHCKGLSVSGEDVVRWKVDGVGIDRFMSVSEAMMCACGLRLRGQVVFPGEQCELRSGQMFAHYESRASFSASSFAQEM